jgi:hypothetical protein
LGRTICALWRKKQAHFLRTVRTVRAEAAAEDLL